ncbi:c-type cytochrome [Moraxella sp. ZY200743]|uniref:c-type cytochrome n=1 Tax=Moraxella sp. ZY200743 TaxID=2911970 RepID=UPI003D7D9F9F
MKTLIKTATIIAAATVALSACSSTTTPTDVQARQDIMQDWRISSDIMKGMMDKPDIFDAKTFKEQADLISASSKEVWTHFANPENKGSSQDTIWSDAQGFKEKADEFNAAADALVNIAQNAQSIIDVEPALGKVLESCGSCHKTYKQK